MRIGQLRDRITLQRLSTTPARDSFGQATEPWVDVATIYADVIELSGRELSYARQSGSLTTIRIEARHRTDVTADMRAKFGNRVLNFESIINPDGRKIALHIGAFEKATGAA